MKNPKKRIQEKKEQTIYREKEIEVYKIQEKGNKEKKEKVKDER